MDFLKEENPDILCLQEIKAMPNQVELDTPEYRSFWNPAVRKGYSGTLVLTKKEPENVILGMNKAEHDQEGRVVTLEFAEFFLINVYTPNSQNELKRLDYRMKWDRTFTNYLQKLRKIKPVITCGDFNVAHEEIDLKNPKSNRKNAGFTDEEREGFSRLINKGYLDTFREFNQEPENYSWWSYRAAARERNVGWRIDYFLVSNELKPNLLGAEILPEVHGSDHCPVGLRLKNLK